MSSDWLSRYVYADLYPRREDPFRPAPGAVPMTAPPASMLSAEELISTSVYEDWITSPAQRPIVYQRALNFVITAGVTPLPLTNGAFQSDTIVLDVLSTAANSVFFGYGSAVNATSGLEIRPGLPISIAPENTREQWEIQRLLEAIAAMIAAERGYAPIGQFRAPRVVFNTNEYYVMATAPTNIAIMLFLVPEGQ